MCELYLFEGPKEGLIVATGLCGSIHGRLSMAAWIMPPRVAHFCTVPFTDACRLGKDHVVFAAHSFLSTDVTTVTGSEFRLCSLAYVPWLRIRVTLHWLT